ncbi:MAG: hypothetical protein ACI8WT_000160 [Clostridium sp.]|jgi:hypothetical protein
MYKKGYINLGGFSLEGNEIWDLGLLKELALSKIYTSKVEALR